MNQEDYLLYEDRYGSEEDAGLEEDYEDEDDFDSGNEVDELLDDFEYRSSALTASELITMAKKKISSPKIRDLRCAMDYYWHIQYEYE